MRQREKSIPENESNLQYLVSSILRCSKVRRNHDAHVGLLVSSLQITADVDLGRIRAHEEVACQQTRRLLAGPTEGIF